MQKPPPNNIDLIPLLEWFQIHQRDLPWRSYPTPYQVWISEIMLQQTQVAVVIPYYEKWMSRFPTIEHLAKASLDDVIKCWEGLGYYSRARNIHTTAKILLDQYSGNLPKDKKTLQSLKGLGPYTVGAIRGFAFNEKEPALDGNVMRVLSRLFLITSPIDEGKTRKEMTELLDQLISSKTPWIINEALIELGALICTKTPTCSECPLRKSCLAYQHNRQSDLPLKKNKTNTEKIYRSVAVITSNNTLLLQKGTKGKVMSDLYEFPYFPSTPNTHLDESHLIKQRLNLNVSFEKILPPVTHTFTRFHATLYPSLYTANSSHTPSNYEWISLSEIHNLPFSSGHRRILSHITLEEEDK